MMGVGGKAGVELPAGFGQWVHICFAGLSNLDPELYESVSLAICYPRLYLSKSPYTQVHKVRFHKWTREFKKAQF